MTEGVATLNIRLEQERYRMDRKRKAMDEVGAVDTMEEYNSSEDLFADDDVDDVHALSAGATADSNVTADDEGMRSFAGVSVASLAKYTRFSSPSVSPRASVFVEWPREARVFRPHPTESRARDSWDDRHVRMPFSKDSVFPVSEAGGRKALQYRLGRCISFIPYIMISVVSYVYSYVIVS